MHTYGYLTVLTYNLCLASRGSRAPSFERVRASPSCLPPVSLLSPSCLPPFSLLSPSSLPPVFGI